MIEIEYKREDGKNFMLADRKNDSNNYLEKMITNAKIEHLLPVEIRNFNGESKYYYDIRAKQAICMIFENNKLTLNEIKELFRCISEVISELEEFLLPLSNLVLLPESIFSNPENLESYFCYYPEYQNDVRDSFSSFAEWILNHIDYSDDEGAQIAYKYYEKVMEGEFNPYDLLQERQNITEEKYIFENNFDLEMENDSRELEKENAEADDVCVEENNKSIIIEIIGLIINIPVLALFIYFFFFSDIENQFSRYLTGMEITVVKTLLITINLIILTICVYRIIRKKEIIETNSEEEYKPEFTSEEREDNEFNIENSINRKDEMGETVILCEKNFDCPRLVGENIELEINKDHYILGKLSGRVDGVINLKGISRIHCKIIRREDGYYILDSNSTNGTKVNGRYLTVNEKRKLNNNDVISISTIDLTFVDIQTK